MHNSDESSNIEINTNKELTEEEQQAGDSPIDISLTDGDHEANINAVNGFAHTNVDGFVGRLMGGMLIMQDDQEPNHLLETRVECTGLDVHYKNDIVARLDHFTDESIISLGPHEKFKISCPIDNTEGATITGVKSIAAFANPSATKVWATDGSTVDLSTKANASDVLLKKSASGGYYIEENSNKLGWGAFAANRQCTASGLSSFAEGCITKALGSYAHAEGYNTTANGYSTHAEGENTQATQMGAHAEGYYTVSNGQYSHAEGNYTEASGFCAHAQGAYNIANKNAIHSVGIGNNTTRKNAEYIYVKNSTDGTSQIDDPKNGYKYLIGVGGYDGISTDNTTYKSVQEVIADLTARIEQLETKVRALEAANTPA